MNPNKIVKACAIVVISSVVIVCSLNFSNEEDVNLILSDYNKTTQDFSRINVNTIITSLSSSTNQVVTPNNTNQQSGTTGNVPIVNTNNTWLEICDTVHRQWGKAGFGYGKGVYKEFQPPGSQSTVEIRIDCSGYVKYCLYVAGYNPNYTNCWSGTKFSDFGFPEVPKPPNGFTLNDLQPGDIVTWDNHVQIYCGPTGEDIWWNWGSSRSTSDKYAGGADPATVDNKSKAASGFYNTPVEVFRVPTQ